MYVCMKDMCGARVLYFVFLCCLSVTLEETKLYCRYMHLVILYFAKLILNAFARDQPISFLFYSFVGQSRVFVRLRSVYQ